MVNGYPNSLEPVRKQEIVLLYVSDSYAQTLFDSTNVTLPFSQVSRSVVYKYDPNNFIGPYLAGFFTPILIVGILASTGSCPVVYAENPEGFTLEGEIYVGATHPQLERPDWLPLTRLRPDSGLYRLRIRNEAREIEHTDWLEMLAVDHPAGSMVLYDKYGVLHSLSNLESPVSATDLEGRNVQNLLARQDEQIFYGSPENNSVRAEDGVILTFRRPAGAREARLLVRAKNSVWLDPALEMLQQEMGEYGPQVRQMFLEKDSAELQKWALDQNLPLSVWLETAPDQWQRADFFNLAGPETFKSDVLTLDLTKIKGDPIRVKLTTGFMFWEIDYVALDFSKPQLLRTQVLPLQWALDQNGQDLREALGADDGNYYVQPAIGDEARLRFEAPATGPAMGQERSLFLHAKGYYTILRDPVEGRPSKRYLRRFRHADAFPKYSRDRWNEWMSRDTLWTAGSN